ncbi:AMP-binding protein [Stappia sp. GBMRC 2046]|uniref:AMP-binding protein n=1 Tax=Stappia sediminis TaxID=2692190 RepID=A0A7X3LWI6_9HYPH|nr:AMP-binding protein [Stappia sediminis]MXN66352.1 AMP-binding protein [Stappia sediminis]
MTTGAIAEEVALPLEPAPLPGEEYRDLPARIRDHARKRPHAVALIDDKTRLSAAELADMMDRTASALSVRGVGPGDVVATLAGVTADHLLAYLGTVALGAAVAPLPVSAHTDALRRMLDNSAAVLTLVDERAPHIPEAASLSGLVAEARSSSPRAPHALSPDGLFDIIYSSGTTGHPKGIEHDTRFRDRQIARLGGLGFGPEAVCLVSTPIYSNTTLAALLPALGQGARIVLQRKFDELAFLELAERHRVTHAMLVPVQIRRLIEHPAFGRFDLSAFKVKLSTSAPLPPALLREVLERWPGRMINIYGMTEGGVSTLLDCGAHPDKLHTVGHPVRGAEIRVIGEDGQALPPGEVGEIVGRSATIMRGYRAAPEATRATTWISPEGWAFIRSGDMGRLDADGFVVLMDRKKDVIISGGFNIYASDLEAVLCSHPAVHEAAVVGVDDPRWGETPVGYVTLKSAADANDIREWANERLGRTQRLSAVAILDALPRNAIGKVLKRDLRARRQTGDADV